MWNGSSCFFTSWDLLEPCHIHPLNSALIGAMVGARGRWLLVSWFNTEISTFWLNITLTLWISLLRYILGEYLWMLTFDILVSHGNLYFVTQWQTSKSWLGWFDAINWALHAGYFALNAATEHDLRESWLPASMFTYIKQRSPQITSIQQEIEELLFELGPTNHYNKNLPSLHNNWQVNHF